MEIIKVMTHAHWDPKPGQKGKHYCFSSTLFLKVLENVCVKPIGHLAAKMMA